MARHWCDPVAGVALLPGDALLPFCLLRTCGNFDGICWRDGEFEQGGMPS